MDKKSLIQLLFDGVNTGELVDAIETGKVRGIDRYAREDQIPQGKDREDLLDSVEYHLRMDMERGTPFEWWSEKCKLYWFNKPPRDWGGDMPAAIDRYYLKDNSNFTANEKVKSILTTSQLTERRIQLDSEEKEIVRQLCIPLIDRGKLQHNKIADEIFKTANLKRLSPQQVMNVVKQQCRAEGREDLIRGLRKK